MEQRPRTYPEDIMGLSLLLALLLQGCPTSGPKNVDTGVPENPDVDLDGHLSALAGGDDCNDAAPSIHPGADEYCNNIDDDCDYSTDEDAIDARTWFIDADADGYGGPKKSQAACIAPPGTASTANDCDDTRDEVHPSAWEICDDLDNDCDNEVDEACTDFCGDGVAHEDEECDLDDDLACPDRCSSYCHCPSAPATSTLTITMVDVGQGDAILVRSPDGFVMLVDAGPWANDGVIQRALEAQDLTDLDYTLLTHNHSDHYGSMEDVLWAHAEVDRCFDHGVPDDAGYWRDYAWVAGSRRTAVFAGDTLDLGPAIQADVLHAWIGSDNENLNSVVLRLTFADVTVLLGGDCEFPGCEMNFNPGSIDLYKVHHHGSSDSSSQWLLDRMEPKVAIIPVGVDNDYGHPSDEALFRLGLHDTDVFRTDLDGGITVTIDGHDMDVSTERG